ncbi:hypothetical protein PF002_g27821 [Phytophthora fragariae]|uniref:Uncharacterized protein n=2 Tax=Phytophthora fragariae TaxID=53985 RepID=A0A6A3WAT3_9STRA|nr:hypothetical protein PF003_g37108 [Phytophthora fragariae]KAE9176383.1 hypothetical protein PF004_g26116 [Phytophthora fragariae]KAE9179417.1 hypothetical protein PF002_g27821 [Phytophthora fragariae]
MAALLCVSNEFSYPQGYGQPRCNHSLREGLQHHPGGLICTILCVRGAAAERRICGRFLPPVSESAARLVYYFGSFPKGPALIKKVRALNNYFNTPQRFDRLTEMQRYYGLPELSTIVDCDTRVVSTVSLFQRTIINYAAFKAYFEQCATYDDPQVFSKLDFADWRLLVEMEAVTESLAELARIEVQRSNQVASELIVLLKFAINRLYADSYNIYDMDVLRTSKTNEKTLPRRSFHLSALSAEDQICIARVKG